MGVLQVVDVNSNRVMDEISFYKDKISYANGLAQNVFESTKNALGFDDERTFHHLNGWSNGYLRIIPKPGTHPELETETASTNQAEERMIDRINRLEQQAHRAIESDRRRRFNEARKTDALWFMRPKGSGGSAISAESPDA